MPSFPLNAPASLPAAAERPSTVEVCLGERSYPILIRSGSGEEDAGDAAHAMACSIIEHVGDCSHVVVIADAAVAKSLAEPLAGALRAHSVRVDLLTVPPGETSKSIEQLATLWNALLGAGTDRRSVVVAVGGGVVGDLAGFVAATFTRGLRLVQVPTTLLSMVDSSVGGKTGINLPGGKNLAGAFWQPSLVLIETQSLATLPDREFRSGLAEVIKYGVIDDSEFFDWLSTQIEKLVARHPATLASAIRRSCQSKANVVGDDERETSGRRAILNYGHTFAHAIESTAGYGHFLHGEAVAIGMQMAAKLAVALGRCDATLLTRQTDLLVAAGLPVTWSEADAAAMLPVMARDKKVAHGKLRFVLPCRLGQVELVGDVDPSLVIAAIEQTRHAASGLVS